MSRLFCSKPGSVIGSQWPSFPQLRSLLGETIFVNSLSKAAWNLQVSPCTQLVLIVYPLPQFLPFPTFSPPHPPQKKDWPGGSQPEALQGCPEFYSKAIRITGTKVACLSQAGMETQTPAILSGPRRRRRWLLVALA